MKLLTIYDHCDFAKEMKMGNIKTNTSLWVSSRKIKDLLHSISLELFRKKYFCSGKNSNLKLDKCTFFNQKKKIKLFYIVLFLFISVLKVC
jgi:hypothetical protein